MATTIVMPQMGYDMQEGTVVRWHKQEGENVARGDIIAEIETDKATVEFEAFTSGVLRKIVAQEGAIVPVGELIAVITDPDESLPEGILPTAQAPQESSPAVAAADGPAAVAAQASEARGQGASSTGEVRASPIARRLARERGIDLARVTGTGPGGRIVEEGRARLPGSASRRRSSTGGPGRRGPCFPYRPALGQRARHRLGSGYGHRPRR